MKLADLMFNDDPSVIKDKYFYYKRTFFTSLILASLIIFPFVIVEWIRTGEPIFFYYGDYNVQQLPFYEHCVRMVHEGKFGWDWNTDLGSNFIGSYSYYLLGSPFFWIMCLFPASWAPYLMAPIYVLKFAVAAVLAYAYLQRFVKNKSYAVLGALLYAFSGFQIYNIFFNQFHEVVALFPLLLLGMEELVQNDRKGLFCIAVALNCMCNYFMFCGQVVFCIVYFLFRCATRTFKITGKRFFNLAFEAVCGVAIASLLFLPAIFGLIGNTRLGSFYSGIKMFFWYKDGSIYTERYGHILQSLFFPPDIPSRVNFFYGHETRWASNAAWVPLFGMTGAFAFMHARKKSVFTYMIPCFVIFAFVPLLNSTFFMLNSSYYARWIYMLIMLLVVATIAALDDDKVSFKGATLVSAGVITAVTFYCGLMWHLNDERTETTYSLGREPFSGRLWISVVIALGSLALLFYIIKRYRKTPAFARVLTLACCGVIVLYSVVHITCGKNHSSNTKTIVKEAINGEVDLHDDSFYRIDFFRKSGVYTNVYDNLGISWEIPSVECFHTVVPPSIMEFYDSKNGVADGRAVGSRNDYKYYGLRPFLSVKYSFIRTGSASKHYGHEKGYNFEKYDEQAGYTIFKDENCLDMGFSYDYFMTESEYNKISKGNRHILLVKYLIVPDEMHDYYASFMTEAVDPDTEIAEGENKVHRVSANQKSFEAALTERRDDCCDTFEYDSYSFTATTTLDSKNVVLFSVPYDLGWSAYVNGEKKDVLRVTYGFMAVECESGYNEIEFRYETPGLKVGALVTLGGIVLLTVYLVISKKKGEKPSYRFFTESYYEIDVSSDPRPDEKEKAADEATKDKTEGETE